jgi:hypothetical protein
VTGEQSKHLKVGDRVCWQKDHADSGTIKEKSWAGVIIKWDNRSEQAILNNDMGPVERAP